MKQLIQTTINKLNFKEGRDKANLFKDIASNLSEHIKSEIRKGRRYESAKYQIKTMLGNEFGIDIDDQKLMTIIHMARGILHESGIWIVIDEVGIVANKAMRYTVGVA